MSNLTFVIIDEDKKNALKIKALAESFQGLSFVGYASNYDNGLDVILENSPALVFLSLNLNSTSDISLGLINELYRYFNNIPRFFIVSNSESLCFNAYKNGASGFFLNPVDIKELRKAVLSLKKEISNTKNINPEFIDHYTATGIPVLVKSSIDSKATVFEMDEEDEEEKNNSIQELLKNRETIIIDQDSVNETINQVENELELNSTEENGNNNFEEEIIGLKADLELEEEENREGNSKTKDSSFFNDELNNSNELIVCIKSYGDYRYIEAKDICYLQADNNSTDLHLSNGEMVTAFKTLKHFENVLKYPFIRIHNSYIVNINYVSRIHTGNAVCHIKNTTTKLPFSKSYKENVDSIINKIASGNYLEV